MTQTRPAAVAGSFYPGQAPALRQALAGHLARAGQPAAATRPPKLLVVPHAGYIYSGDMAGRAYALLAPQRGRIRRVVLLGPTHRVAVRGICAPLAEAFETPLGRVAVDQAALAALADLPQLQRSDRPHAQEHALEVQLPFLQAVLGDGFALVPLAVGEATPAQVDELLERLWGGDETLVLISSDLSHYLPYAQARERDQATVQRILDFADDLGGDEACGAMALNGALRSARRHGLVPRLLGLCNSGDTAGSRDRVVGYGAIAFEAAPAGAASSPDADAAAAADPATLGPALLTTARAEIAGALGLAAPEVPAHARLLAPGASFVTLHDGRGALRGCIGQLEASRALGEDVRHNARAAAFGDSRFKPLASHEWAGLQVEVSVLDPLEALAQVATQAEGARQLRPGIDGVLLEWQGRRGTFLPQVWSQLPQPQGFLQALLQKAGLPRGFWAADIRLWRYRVTAFAETGHAH